MNNAFHPAYARTRFRMERAPARWPSAFAIISAYATTGETWPKERNEEADRRLADVLAACAPWTHRLIGF